jgi:hypothetical protein
VGTNEKNRPSNKNPSNLPAYLGGKPENTNHLYFIFGERRMGAESGTLLRFCDRNRTLDN